jgi:uncharacterized membrane protein YeiB
MLAQSLFIIGASIMGLLGGAHLALTFFGHRLDPRDPATISAMQATVPRLTRDTSVWQCWIGFNASHSLGALLFAAVYLVLAVGHIDVLRASNALAWLACVGSAAYLVLAHRYWFRVPLLGILVATACFLAGTIVLPG